MYVLRPIYKTFYLQFLFPDISSHESKYFDVHHTVKVHSSKFFQQHLWWDMEVGMWYLCTKSVHINLWGYLDKDSGRFFSEIHLFRTPYAGQINQITPHRSCRVKVIQPIFNRFDDM